MLLLFLPFWASLFSSIISCCVVVFSYFLNFFLNLTAKQVIKSFLTHAFIYKHTHKLISKLWLCPAFQNSVNEAERMKYRNSWIRCRPLLLSPGLRSGSLAAVGKEYLTSLIPCKPWQCFPESPNLSWELTSLTISRLILVLHSSKNIDLHLFILPVLKQMFHVGVPATNQVDFCASLYLGSIQLYIEKSLRTLMAVIFIVRCCILYDLQQQCCKHWNSCFGHLCWRLPYFELSLSCWFCLYFLLQTISKCSKFHLLVVWRFYIYSLHYWELKFTQA